MDIPHDVDPWADDPYSDDGFEPEDYADPDYDDATDDSEENHVAPTNNMTVNTDGKITITLKRDGGYDAPWVVVRGDTPAEVYGLLSEIIGSSGLLKVVADAATAFGATKPAPQAAPQQQYQQQAPQGGGYQQPQQAPQQQGGGQLPPGVEPKFCNHGQMVYRSGVNKWNKPYQAFFCPTPKNTPDQCKAVFI